MFSVAVSRWERRGLGALWQAGIAELRGCVLLWLLSVRVCSHTYEGLSVCLSVRPRWWALKAVREQLRSAWSSFFFLNELMLTSRTRSLRVLACVRPGGRFSLVLEGCGPALITDSTDESPLLWGFWNRDEADVSRGAGWRVCVCGCVGVCVCVCGGGRLDYTMNPFISCVYGSPSLLFFPRYTWLAVVLLTHISTPEESIAVINAQMKTDGRFELNQLRHWMDLRWYS